MTILEGIILLTFLIIATLTDFISERIPNEMIVIAYVLFILLKTVLLGPSGSLSFLGSSCIALLALFPLFIIDAMGAGDIKLLLIVAGVSGLAEAGRILMISFFAGGLYAVIKFLVKRIILNDKDKPCAAKKMRFGWCILSGFIINWGCSYVQI